MHIIQFALFLFLLAFESVLSFKCWMCPGGAASFAACDGFRTVEQCKQGTDSCGIFSFENATGFRIYAKSCTYRSWCSDADEFCKNIRQGGHYCRIQCCHSELCNYVPDFRSTTPRIPTGSTTDHVTTEETPFPTTQTITTAVPDEEDTCEFKEEECSWIDTGPAVSVSGYLFMTCVVFAIVFLRF